MLDMAQHQILPAALHYTRSLCESISSKKSLGITCRAETSLAQRLSDATDGLYDGIEKLKADLTDIPADPCQCAQYYHNTITADMQTVREKADLLEQLTDKSYWPYPTYSDLLFY